MLKRNHTLTGAFVTKACCVTTIINGLYSTGQAQSVGRGQDLWHKLNAASPGSAPADPWKKERETTLRYGAIDLYPFVRGGFVSDDNIYTTERKEKSDLIWTFSPGILFATGDYRQKIAEGLANGILGYADGK